MEFLLLFFTDENLAIETGNKYTENIYIKLQHEVC